MYKSRFRIFGETEEFEGYTDGSLWNGWANVCFTREQVKVFLDTTPYNYKFDNTSVDGCTLFIYWNGGEMIWSTPLPTDNGEIFEGFFLDGIKFVEVEE